MPPPCELSAGAASGAAASEPASLTGPAPRTPEPASAVAFEAAGPASGVNPVPDVDVLGTGTESELVAVGIEAVGVVAGAVVVGDPVSEGAPVGWPGTVALGMTSGAGATAP